MKSAERTRFTSHFSSGSTEISTRYPKIEQTYEVNSTQRTRRRPFNEGVRFTPIRISMKSPNTLNEHVVLQQSSKMILKSISQELLEYGNQLKHLKSNQQEIISLCKELLHQLGKDYDQIETYLFVLLNKCRIVSNSLGLLFLFVTNVILEAYGRRKDAIQNWRGMLEKHNKEKLNGKLMIYYRLGFCYIRQSNFDKVILVGKKQLKLSWYQNNQDYELKAYQLLSKGQFGKGNLDQAAVLQTRFFDGTVQPNDHIRDLGINQLLAQQRSQTKYRSPSVDQFDLELLCSTLDHQKLRMKLIGGKSIFKSQSQQCEVCAQYINNEKIELKDYYPYKKNVLLLSGNSRQRDYISYFESDQIQQLYKPKETLPVLRALIFQFIEFI